MFGCQETEKTKTKKKKKKKTPSLSSFTQEDGVKPNNSNNNNNNNNTKKTQQFNTTDLKLFTYFPSTSSIFFSSRFLSNQKKRDSQQINKDPQFFSVPKREKKEKNSKRVGKEG